MLRLNISPSPLPISLVYVSAILGLFVNMEEVLYREREAQILKDFCLLIKTMYMIVTLDISCSIAT